MEITLPRKMRLLPSFLFLAVSALAADNTNYYEQPMDYFDGINSNFKVNPNSKFSFNFEQTRRDQPPQIEMREEDVGRYFQTRPQTTTPTSKLSMKADRGSKHVYPMLNNNYQPQGQWSQPQVAPMPPPPKLDFSRHINPPRNPPPVWSPPAQQNVQTPNSFNNFPPQVPNVGTPPPHPAQWSQPPKPQSTPPPYYAPPAAPPKPPAGVSFAPSASYVSDSIRNNGPRQTPSLANRGSHKFSWDDVQKPEQFKQIVNQQPHPAPLSAPQSIHNKPPPPVPTLSPWYDNFGK
ncbi:uncharacterized protein LOC112054547 [Bicyclus anynana]|uniref:Uncharacterized protein LOC112054547 n=1 Tax=Bicyclus anynana TaxID=110368 RepID=A0A6J1NR05_BICAN|nr:uncharacterized protein LOC112054547 [Bicyclus anynana]